MEIREGLHHVEVPVPYPMRTVNTFLCEGRRGWTLVDTGCNTAETREFWRRTLRSHGVRKGELDVFVSHFHPDHVGAAGWLQQEWGALVHMHGPDRRWTQFQWAHLEEHARLIEEQHVLHGCPKELAADVTAHYLLQREHVDPLPERIEDFAAGDRVALGEWTFEVVPAPGHADGMVVFWQPEERLLLAADALLPRITPNVGLWPLCSVDPLADYRETLETIRGLAPALTYGGHGPAMEQTSKRVGEVIRHHRERLAATKQLVRAGARSAYEIAVLHFGLTDLTAHQVRFALAETLAHLVYLQRRGQMEETMPSPGKREFRLVGEA